MFQFVPLELLPLLTDLSPYSLVVLRKGSNYDQDDTVEIIQSKHLPYLFRLREKGIVLLSFTVLGDGDIRAIAIYDLQNRQEIEEHIQGDPAIQACIFNYEILGGLGIKGDTLT